MERNHAPLLRRDFHPTDGDEPEEHADCSPLPSSVARRE
ncbi:hypothetical protein CTS44_04264 [Comamonas thiooxydans]|nr:hypothetical protein CTS44_04264 [Comamonas thiooxydans]